MMCFPVLLLGSSVHHGAEVSAELQSGGRGGRPRQDGLHSAGGAAEQTHLGQTLSVRFLQPDFIGVGFVDKDKNIAQDKGD